MLKSQKQTYLTFLNILNKLIWSQRIAEDRDHRPIWFLFSIPKCF